MNREGKHDRYSRELCEALLQKFGAGYHYKPAPEHALIKTGESIQQGIAVALSGGSPGPEKLLEFEVGISHRALTDVIARLGLEHSYQGFHFLTTTLNAPGCLVPDTRAMEGQWIINLNSNGSATVRTVFRCLAAVMKAFFARFGKLKSARDAVVRDDGSCFTLKGWELVVLCDLALGDVTHLRKFLATSSDHVGFQPDPKLLERIPKAFPELKLDDVIEAGPRAAKPKAVTKEAPGHGAKDYTREYSPGREYDEDDPATQYWTKDGKVFFEESRVVKGADLESFRFYLGSFAKDKNQCYSRERKLAGADPATFRALNFTYATDGRNVWAPAASSGKIDGADVKSFVVCDDGVDSSDGDLSPFGYAKDKGRVYYFEGYGTVKWVRKASAASFVSLNDGNFGKDDHFVFCGAAALPKANAKAWRKLGALYSKDDSRVYYANRELPDADHGSFEFVKTEKSWDLRAKDKNHLYDAGRVVGRPNFAK